MKPKSVMLIAGEASGDASAAELVRELAEILPEASGTGEVQPAKAALRPRFFGAGGPKMAKAGVELAFDLTAQSAIGFSDVVKKLPVYWGIFHSLVRLAAERQPDVIVLVDFGGFNRRFAHAIQKYLQAHRGPFYNWRPKIVQYVSPQVWASRPGRAAKLARDIDLLLCLFPFEKEWYAQRVPQLSVECVGHPLFDRHEPEGIAREGEGNDSAPPLVALLPGSRDAELRRHLPVILEAAKAVSVKQPVRLRMVLPSQSMADQARSYGTDKLSNLQIQIGGLSECLAQASLAIASTGTVTLECAHYGVPTVALYKTSWSTYEIGRRIIQVRFLAMPNLLANEALYPEFVQHDATGENIARASIDLLTNPVRRREIQAKLKKVMSLLGGAGAAHRAALAIADLLRGE